MKKLIFLLLLFSSSIQAQSLYREVNGTRVKLSPEDSAAFINESIANAVRDSLETIEEEKIAITKGDILFFIQQANVVGVRYDQLTTSQLRLLFGLVLFKEGAIDSSLRIRPLNIWVK